MNSNKNDSSPGLFTVKCNACSKTFPAEAGQCECGSSKGELILDIDKMLESIYSFHSQDKVDEALDIIFDVYWNLYNKFDIMNDILAKIDVTKIGNSIIVGFLMQTFKYIKQVPNHLPFCDRAAAQMKAMGADDKKIHDLVDNYRKTGDYWKAMEAYGAPTFISGPKPEDE